MVKEKYQHRYPYSDRGKNPIIFKLTAQWFIDIDNSGIRQKAMEETEHTMWIPDTGKNRMLGMLKTRKEWLLSRQRMWGVPIMWFIKKDSGEVLLLPLKEMEEITEKILDKLSKESYDFWYSTPLEELSSLFLPQEMAREYVASMDIFDVWFESGMVHDYVGNRHDQNQVADIYIEGSDQHRGWFQSSLLTSVALYNKAPYKTVMTHGFVLDEKGAKMSKSLGNTQSMEECISNFGNDVMRLWVVSSDFTEEIRFGSNSMERSREIYQTIRNRFKFLLAVLNGQKQESFMVENMPFLEQYILAKIFSLQEQINKKIGLYLYREIFTLIMDFLNHDLSKLYFFCRKDTLYCDSENNINRIMTIYTMHIILTFLLYNFSFIIPFLTEEIFTVYNRECLEKQLYQFESVHLMDQFIPHFTWENPSVMEKMEKIEKIGNQIMPKVEIAIKNHLITTPSEAVIHFENNNFVHENKKILIEIYKMADFVTQSNLQSNSEEKIGENHIIDPEILVSKTKKDKCERCWNFVIDNYETLCPRCKNIMG